MTKVKIRNYRSIPYNAELKFEIDEGITFFLGKNNIGKSNILKFFYEFRNIFSLENKDFHEGQISSRRELNDTTFARAINQESPNSIISFEVEHSSVINKLKIEPVNKDDLDQNSFKFSFSKEGETISDFIKGEFGHVRSLFTNSLYIGSFRTPSFNSNGIYYDIKIGTDFVKEWDRWANGNSVKQRNRISKLIEELKNLFEYKIFNISINPNKTNLIIRTELGSFQLDELGSGIGHFILVLGNALISEPDFILIDEPEIGLHPKLQQTFITTLASKAKKGLLATSHSIGLARSTADNIYSLTKNVHTDKVEINEFGSSYKPSIIQSINELGYSQFVEIGGNNILLVEGRTDIKVFKEILRKYKLEHAFIIMDLGGSNTICRDSFEELNELKRLNAKSYSVIIDSEISEEGEEPTGKIKDFVDVCHELEFNIFLTEYHSTDNYISQDAINEIIGDKYSALDKYENLERRSAKNKWGKKLNWKMIKYMSIIDFKDTLLEEFILQKLKPLTIE